MIPQLQSPPRVRVEWLIAGARVVLAGGTAAAVALTSGAYQPWAVYLLGWYLIYSVALLALVWKPVRFARGWDTAVHAVDVAAYGIWLFQPDDAANVLPVYFVFVVVCATIRWQIAGTVWTAAVAFCAYAAASLSALDALTWPALGPVAARGILLLLIATLIGYLGTHQNRFQYEIGRLASWPRRPARDPREIVSEIMRQSSEFLGASRIVLVWEEPGEGWVNVVWQAQDEIMWTHEPEATYGSFVIPALERTSFQTEHADDDTGRVVLIKSRGFGRRRCRPVNEALRARFNMSAVQSWPLDGELVRGRMFCLDRQRMRLDDLVLGEVVAWLTLTRLESHYWQDRLRDAAAVDERVRLARDLHDSLLQTQAGAALQLEAARRLLDRDAAAGRQRLADVQKQLERDELETRSFVTRLRPTGRPVVPVEMGLRERLDELSRRVERQWEIHVKVQAAGVDDLPSDAAEATYRLAQESVVNAARHADASVIDVDVAAANGTVRLRVADDGRGFPFQGTYNLEALNRMNGGPLTLKERIAELSGDMTLVSTDTGTELRFTVPVGRARV
jgi:signal transduction histidine kinase